MTDIITKFSWRHATVKREVIFENSYGSTPSKESKELCSNAWAVVFRFLPCEA